MQNAGVIKEYLYTIAVSAPGVLLFGLWLCKTSLGTKALKNSPPRRNNMPLYAPFLPLLIWIITLAAATFFKETLLRELPDWQNAFIENVILCIAAVAAMAVILFLANSTFARRLKGFGLDMANIGGDFLAAILNLVCAWPLVMITIIVTVFFGELLFGPEFQLQQHEELEMIKVYTQPSLRVLIIVTAVFIVPVFEEMLFRGLFQTMLRSLLGRPWLSVLISSALFASVHSNPQHWPALLVLALFMGYAYEKSGSLFRPVFIHSLFNAVSITSALYLQ